MKEEWIRQWTDQRFANSEILDERWDIRAKVDIELLFRLQRLFMTATGLNGSVADMNGLSITQDMDNHAPLFCRLIHSAPDGWKRCVKSDKRVMKESIGKGRAVIRQCHAGLYDSAVPIRHNQHSMGAFLAGQVLFEPPDEAMVETILRRVEDLGLDRDELAAAIRDIPQINKEKLMAATEFMKLMVDYIAKTLEEAEVGRRDAEWRALLRETEMKVMQSKLHPNFLFNVVNLISGLAFLEEAPETHEAVGHLAKLLRYLVKTQRPLVTVEEELENIDSYIRLQILRFDDRLDFQVRMKDRTIGEVFIPSLTLQMLVENAIKHGVEQKEGPCFVYVRFYRQEEYIVVEVEDNGAGVSPERLRMLNDGNDNSADALSGMNMLRKRLEYFYKENFFLHISSGESKGTLVKIRIPTIKGR